MYHSFAKIRYSSAYFHCCSVFCLARMWEVFIEKFKPPRECDLELCGDYICVYSKKSSRVLLGKFYAETMLVDKTKGFFKHQHKFTVIASLHHYHVNSDMDQWRNFSIHCRVDNSFELTEWNRAFAISQAKRSQEIVELLSLYTYH